LAIQQFIIAQFYKINKSSQKQLTDGENISQAQLLLRTMSNFLDTADTMMSQTIKLTL